MTADARDLVRRLRTLQDRRQELTTVKDYAGAETALELAVSLIDPCGLPTLREALLHATNPANALPVPVVLGPEDLAAVVSRDELMALVTAYGQACYSLGRREATQADCKRTYDAVELAVERLCAASPTYELGGGRTS